VSNIIYFGSAAVYGEDRQQGVITEETQLRPSSYYGIAKRASEEVLLKWANQSKVENVVILRPTLVYGYGDESNAYGPTGFVYAAIKEKPVILWGDGRELRDFVYIEDIGYIVSFLLKSNISGIFNLSTGNSCSFIDILEYLKEYFPALKVLSRDRTKSKINQRYSIDKLLGVLPSEFAFTPINRGLEKLIINSRIK